MYGKPLIVGAHSASVLLERIPLVSTAFTASYIEERFQTQLHAESADHVRTRDRYFKEDQLGLDIIYLQAKRWEEVVGRPEIQKFAGALLGQNARKGIFVTTSSFTKEARDYVRRLDSKIILIDGAQFPELMIDHNVGVTTAARYEIGRVDPAYSAEE